VRTALVLASMCVDRSFQTDAQAEPAHPDAAPQAAPKLTSTTAARGW
jgi:hypothetical protein